MRAEGTAAEHPAAGDTWSEVELAGRGIRRCRACRRLMPEGYLDHEQTCDECRAATAAPAQGDLFEQ